MSAATRTVSREEIRVGEGASTTILLYLLLLSLTGSIAAADWAEDLGLLTLAGIAGLTVGIALAKIRRLPGMIAHLLMLTLAVPGTATLTSTVLPNALTYKEKLIVLQERVQVWLTRVGGGGTGSDNLIFVMQLGLLTWMLAYFAAWFVYRRHQVWGAIIPTGLALVVNLFYAAPQTGLYFGLFILCALLLLVRLNLQTMEQWWRSAAIGYPPDITFDFLWYGTVFTLVLMFLVWLLPASAPGPTWLSIFEPLQTPWQSVEDQFNRVFNSLRAVGRPSSAAFFGTTLTMGGPVHLGQNPVMDVRSDYARYWRATVYDKYTGIGWINTHLDSTNLGAHDPRLDQAREAYRAEVTQTIKLYLNDQNILYAQSQPIRFDLPIEVRYARQQPADVFDIALVRSRRPLREGTTYTAVSAISVADEDALRADSLRYSEWITATYLQLPDELPARVRTLAQTITAPFDNPYDKAAALERYLRERVKYNELVAAPPSGRDGVDYTLFDRPEGYCNYYASAMAVMARAVGVPARVVSGYSLGEYADGVYHVVEANAHAWVEAYFPSYGWVEFEPTASKPEIARPKKPATAPLNPELENAASEARRRNPRDREPEQLEEFGTGLFAPFVLSFWTDPRNLALVGGALAALLVAGAVTFRLVRQARRNARLAPAARVYERMLNRARWLGVREEKSATPLERAQSISRQLAQAESAAESIAAAFTRERYGAYQLDASARGALDAAWDQWQSAWRSGLIALIVERLRAPCRALAANARRVKRRLEHWGSG